MTPRLYGSLRLPPQCGRRPRPSLALVAVTRREVTPEAYRRVTLLALLALVFIVVTGASVRLTGSGLGCPDWPTCDGSQVVSEFRDTPEVIEFVNRMITFLVS